MSDADAASNAQPATQASAIKPQVAPVIIKRVKKNRHDFHGGSWKVAFADFATAMMAFFLLLWLIGNTNDEQKQAISGYFLDPAANPAPVAAVIGDGGSDTALIALEVPAVNPPVESESEQPLDDQQVEELAEQLERDRLEALKLQLETLVDTTDAFADFKDQIMIEITPSGLRIQIVDRDQRPMFDSGSSSLKVYSREILAALAKVLQNVPNQLSIIGHTDATPFGGREGYSNWELSSDRANAARRALLFNGISQTKIARVEGYADSVLYDQDAPTNPINRRIAIIVLKQNISNAIRDEAGALLGSFEPE